MKRITPGPWKLMKRDDYPTKFRIYGHDGKASAVADVFFEDDGMLIESASLLYEASRACRAWHRAETEHIGTFDQRSELCNYSEWATRRALAAVAGEPFTEQYDGVPHLLLTDGEQINVRLAKASEGEAVLLVQSIEAHFAKAPAEQEEVEHAY
jgi:hypothetical protein